MSTGGKRGAEVKTKMVSEAFIIMSFQVVELHKPLWAVSRLAEAGHKALLDKIDSHILLSTGGKLGMTCSGGTNEIEIRIKSPRFIRQNLR